MITDPNVIYTVKLREPNGRLHMVTHQAEVKYYDFGRWQVRRQGSKSWYMVDPASMNKWGLCDCPHHRTRIYPKVRSKEKPPEPYCVHIRLLRKLMKDDLLNETLDAINLMRQNDKQPGPTQGQEG